MTDASPAANGEAQQQQQRPPQTINGGASRPPAPSRGGSTGQLRSGQNHKRSNSEDLTQSWQRQQQMMMNHGGSSGSLGSNGGNFGYGNIYAAGSGGAVAPPPPPHGYYYAYGAPMGAYSHPIMSQSQQLPDYPQQQQWQQEAPGMVPPNNGRVRSWSGDAYMFERQLQQADWMAAMQTQQQQQQQVRTPFNSVRSIPYAAPQQPGTPSSSRHKRSNSSSSVGGGSVGGGSGTPNNGGQFSPRTEFMKLANVGTPNSPRGGSPRGQYASYTAGSGAAAYSPHLQVPMSMPPPPQAYETMYDAFEGSGSAAGSASPYLTPEKQRIYGSSPRPSGSLGSVGGEAVYLAQHARRIATGSSSVHTGPSSSRKRHMRQQSVQLFMQEIKGVEQPPACRDVVFLLFFVFHLFGMVLLSSKYSYGALHGEEDDAREVTVYYKNLLIIACCCGGFAIAVSTTLLAVMSYFARNFVQVALVVAIALSFVWGTLGVGLSPQNLVPITGIVALALTIAYAIVVWDRLPFSTANLRTGLLAVGSYPGTIVMTLVSQVLGLGWSIYYAVICCGIYDAIQDGRIAASNRFEIAIYVLLGISYYWTIQVLLNAVEVATAAVVGQWWYRPESEETVQKSSFKAIFYSMGSICFGSLLVGPVKLIRQFSVFFRPSSDEASLLMFHECLRCIRACVTGCVEGLAEKFNPWGFAYVGLYGYSFTEASTHATELFTKRGWMTIVSDDLVSNVLLMTSIVVGGVTGCFAFLLSGLENLHVTNLETPGVVSFFLGLVIGLVLTSILFGAILGSVNAVIVLFATSPVDFERNHQTLSREMRSAWREVWPGAVDDVDVRLAMAGAIDSIGSRGGHPLLGPMSGGVVPPPPPVIPGYAQLGERTPLMNGR
mmetsp:Transcript_5313/g.10506  ORF Transcript_5313/g.10506 Transcript_5313/m.10506 type:complete len:885 (+) Transcript_5313:474-3128(+)